jgi:ABC-2 type transport system permease protein
MINRTRLLAVARKEIIQLRRDPRSLVLAFLLPVFLVVLFGYAISWDVEHIKLAAVDYDNSARSRELLDTYYSSRYFDKVAVLDRSGDLDDLIDRGTAQVVLVIPPTYAADLDAGRGAVVQAIVDGSDANTATIALNYLRAIAREYSVDVLLHGKQPDLPVEARIRIWYNEELSSRNMIVPGLVAVIMMIISTMLTSLTIAREWERGTMEQLAATPVTRAEVVFGKLIPYVGIGLIDVVLISVVGVVLFEVPFRGNPVLLMVLSLAFLVGALGLGIFVSAAAKSQVLATQLSFMTSFLPAFLLSGFMFDIGVMPLPLQAITCVVPARYFLVVTRGIFLKGVGMEVLYVEALLMVVFAAVGLTLAIRAFKKEIA